MPVCEWVWKAVLVSLGFPVNYGVLIFNSEGWGPALLTVWSKDGRGEVLKGRCQGLGRLGA